MAKEKFERNKPHVKRRNNWSRRSWKDDVNSSIDDSVWRRNLVAKQKRMIKLIRRRKKERAE